MFMYLFSNLCIFFKTMKMADPEKLFEHTEHLIRRPTTSRPSTQNIFFERLQTKRRRRLRRERERAREPRSRLFRYGGMFQQDVQGVQTTYLLIIYICNYSFKYIYIWGPALC